MSKTIGITGGIGSGKSIVASVMDLYGIPVYIADQESKRLINESPVIRERLTALCGSSIYTGKGLDKRALASLIFGDPELLRQVNGIIHPEVNRDFLAWAGRQSAPLCAIESAILFESGFDRIVDIRLMVYAPREIRIERAAGRDKASREEIERRIDSQLPDEVKKERSDYIIYNDGRRALIPQVREFIRQIMP